MAVTFNGITKQIAVTGYADYAVVDVEKELYSAWKRWTVATNNAKYLQAFRPIGGDATGGTQTAPPYFFLMNNWKILVDGIEGLGFNTNLYCEEASNTNTNPFIVINNGSVISKTSDAPVNTIEVSTIAYSLELNGRVFLDVDSGSDSGTHLGTIAKPVKTLTKALAICASENISSIHLGGTLVLDQDVSGKEFISYRNGKIDLNNQPCMATRFKELKLYGTQHIPSVALVYDCRLDSITNINGVFENCKIVTTDDFVVGVDLDMYDCKSQIGGDFISLDLSNGGHVHCKDYSGNISIKNSTSMAVEGQFSFRAGMFKAEPSVTGGVFVPSGGVRIINQSSPPAVVVESGATATPSTVWEYALNSTTNILGAMRVMAAALAGRVSGAETTNIRFTGLGESKTVISATVDSDGNRTNVTTDDT